MNREVSGEDATATKAEMGNAGNAQDARALLEGTVVFPLPSFTREHAHIGRVCVCQ